MDAPVITNPVMVKFGLEKLGIIGGIGRAASMGLGGAALGALLTGKQKDDEETGDYLLRLLRNISVGGLGGAAAPSLLARMPAVAKAVGRSAAAAGRAVGRGALAAGRGVGRGAQALGRTLTSGNLPIPGAVGSMLAGGALGAGTSLLAGDRENLARNIALGILAGGAAPTLMRAGRQLGQLSKLHPSVLGGNIGALLGAGGAGAASIAASKILDRYGQ